MTHVLITGAGIAAFKCPYVPRRVVGGRYLATYLDTGALGAPPEEIR